MNSEKDPVTSIMIVDDHPIVANGIQQLIDREPDMKVINSVQDADSAVKCMDRSAPDLIIVDISLKGSTNGIDLIKGLKKRYPKIKALVLSMHDENLYAERAIKAGAKGYIMKNDLTDNIIRANLMAESESAAIDSPAAPYAKLILGLVSTNAI